MLERSGTHQAAGLAALSASVGPRIVALVSHGDRRGEMPLLWQLCAAWTAQDYPVVVLDATSEETERQPGLQQLLDDQDELGHLCSSREDWPVIAAAHGLAALCRQGTGATRETSTHRASQLAHVLPGYEVILIYAGAGELARTLPAGGLSPLLPVPLHEPALLTAFHALKQLLNTGKLRPTIVAMMDDQNLATRVSGHGVGRNLQDCARDFLACEVPALTVCPTHADEVSRLALRALDNALQPPHLGAIRVDKVVAAAARSA